MAMLLMDETLWARKQLATSLDSYDEYWFVKIVFSFET
jgi:hypothetical protein